jgi:hypothetical protein
MENGGKIKPCFFFPLLKDPLGFIIIAMPLMYSIIFHELAQDVRISNCRIQKII